MNIIKKASLAPIFLLFLSLTAYLFNPYLASIDKLFVLNAASLTEILLLCLAIVASSLSFILFATLAADWKIIFPIAVMSAIIPFIFTNPAIGIILGVLIFASLMVIHLSLENNLKTYTDFKPATLLAPPIRQLITLIILSLCLAFYLSANNLISQKGFEIPDSLIDASLNFVPKDQLEQLKQNPELLKQSGLNLEALEKMETNSSSSVTKNLLKQTVKEQFNTLLEPYKNIIPVVLTLLLFVSLLSLTSLLAIFLSPIIFTIFYLLEKSGLIEYEKEMREVKKLIV
ncbi:hypothetical protein A3C26_00085 [Candidatus Daviesbacteria bacterium RIFCSPHIGHO2_02_FULL_39_12]|uniref:Uncharacterized protein n=2 Tax=Candidatus Daviesiibacteriota TaxID=1752718 RepID=A0A1F5JBT9_9BACT|nr:MAG: hypothetical protein A3C26_00085 [Candidatus Daviesbacteria bacterium RIFCSPHIGHO2_02_FULL_39_12]OGE71358.1 MAG: hypothetical protein A3H40_03635 [Candidatus Daviesbacteria bacterium RIFCSPLOWO2_02_FULL_38_15]